MNKRKYKNVQSLERQEDAVPHLVSVFDNSEIDLSFHLLCMSFSFHPLCQKDVFDKGSRMVIMV